MAVSCVDVAEVEVEDRAVELAQEQVVPAATTGPVDRQGRANALKAGHQRGVSAAEHGGGLAPREVEAAAEVDERPDDRRVRDLPASTLLSTGETRRTLVEAILTERRHPEQGYRSCLGVLRLGKRHGNERLEKACARALVAGARFYRNVDNILTNRLEQLPLPTAPATEAAPVTHENIRGQNYYN